MNVDSVPERRPGAAPLREVLGYFATGVAIITGVKPDGEPVGLTVSSFNSLSLEPPLVLWSLSWKSSSRSAFEVGRPFVVNVLSAKQRAVCVKFARPSPDRFEDVATTPTATGVPMLVDSLAHIECVTDQVIEAGDHRLYIGEVTRTSIASDEDPLLFHRSRLFHFKSGDLG